MPASNAMASGLANRYATALFELASERNALEQVERDLDRLGRTVQDNAELARLLSSPVVSREEHAQVGDMLADRLELGELSRNLLGVLARQRRLGALPALVRAFQQMLAEHRGEETAEVVSAVPLSEDQLASVREGVAGYVGRPVNLTTAVDPALLGGIVVRVGSRMIDTSLKTKMQHLEQSMRGVR